MNYWDTCEDVWTLGLFCRHGNHHGECQFYTKSQNSKYEDGWVADWDWINEEDGYDERLHFAESE